MNDKTNLIPSADLSVEVYPGVFWVPVNKLGRSRLRDVNLLLPGTPESKRAHMETLYEAGERK